MWKEAINAEIDSIMQNHTWELVDLPSGSKPLGCRWVLRRKYKADGSIDNYKAKLVAKGFKQKEGHDFFDTYSLVTRITSIRVLLAIVALHSLEDLGLADVILGIKIERTSEGILLSQSHYIESVLRKFNTFDDPPTKTPMDDSLRLIKNTGEPVAQLEYSRIIGSLMYITNCTRPDLSYSVNKLSRFTSNPSGEHWKALTRVLRYLKYTLEFGLHYTSYPAVLEGYTDANWISNSKDSHSTSGYVFTIGGGIVSWKTTKQTCIARSTMESKFIALDKAGEEAEWLRNFLEDIPYWDKPVSSILIHCNIQVAIGRAQSAMYSGKSRHIRWRHNTVRELISRGIISIDYVKSKENITDPLTKGLNRDQFHKLLEGMGVKSTT
ncbi:hypothetical protein DH2020_023129 [Rehmannia glutinosa]|uniref:Reverse transcriptase Ty1/copia-type domain-containing protein n=1 Tax=Rehmannia glutinosa TaxID=99300 RepID=A0ABR0W7R0_REHGL